MLICLAPINRSRKRSNDTPKLDKRIELLDTAAKKLISSIDPSYNERQLLSAKDSKIQKILNQELDLQKGISGGSIIDFITSMAKDTAKKNGLDTRNFDSYSLFTENVGNIFGYYTELYRNRYIEISDLKFITKFIPAIGEAVKTTLDSICSSDDFSSAISRDFTYNKSLNPTEQAQVESELKRLEKDYKLQKKLKNVVYTKALVSGEHYIYCIPYDELFSEYDRLLKEGRIRDNMLVNNAIANRAMTQATKINHRAGFALNSKQQEFPNSYAGESTADIRDTEPKELPFDPAMEAIIDKSMKDLIDEKTEKQKVSAIRESFVAAFENCYVADTEVLVEALEGFSSADLFREQIKGYRSAFGGNGILEDKSIKTTTTDATGEMNEVLYGKREKFHTSGSYVKYIDTKRLVPVKVFDEIIGYFHVHDMNAKKKANEINSGILQSNIINSSSNIYSAVNGAPDTRQRMTQAIVDAISEGILMNFSNKFVNKNAEFKKLIGDCIVANGFTNNAFQIQFIPAKYIIPFVINENEDGMGQSILQDSLFPAKMLLSVLVSKLLLYMNKSGNKTIAYIRRGPIDSRSSNQIQRVIRMLQESNITFSDLLSTNLSFSKFSRFGNLSLPMARNGDRLIDFETQEGQEVDLHTPMEEYLEKLSILGTGVPSVIMEYTDVADYSRSIVTANIKFAGRIASLQADLEDPTTELYKRLLSTSSLDDDLKEKVIPTLEVKLSRPRVLANINMSDAISSMNQLCVAIAGVMLGESDQNEDDGKIRQTFIKNLGPIMLPYVDWDDLEKILSNSILEVNAKKDHDKEVGEGEDLAEDEPY